MADDKGRKNSGAPDDKGSPFDFLSDELTSSGSESPDKDKSDLGALRGGAKDSGLGNLPPLSDFDSQEGLPSAKKPDSGRGPVSGLPPLSSISVNTPAPTRGRASTPISFGDAAAFETPISDSGLDTPTKGTGFQDLAADSDFSPETPEIGPGPDSDLETPLFDSAFGAGRSFTAAVDTPAPTQAMETPMFGVLGTEKAAMGRDNFGFDQGAFGGAAGTPVPDFSPDTGLQKPVAATPPGKQKKVKAGGGGGMAGTLIAAGLALIIGIGAGIYLPSYLAFLPNPLKADLDKAKADILAKDRTIEQLRTVARGDGPATISQAEVDKLLQQQADLTRDIEAKTTQQEQLAADIGKAQGALDDVTGNIEAKNEEYANAQQLLEEAVNETSIVRARQEGLSAEVQRLEAVNGALQEADARRIASKETLASNIDRLAIQIAEGISLTPEKYSREKRLAAVNALKAKVVNAQFASPALLEEYTSLYQTELSIAAGREYFFGHIPVTDRIGNRTMKWAECLMNGNWSVYYRTLDGKNIGSYENISKTGAPNYQFQENMPGSVKKRIEDEIAAARVPDYMEKINVLAEKETSNQEKTSFQRVFNSL